MDNIDFEKIELLPEAALMSIKKKTGVNVNGATTLEKSYVSC